MVFDSHNRILHNPPIGFVQTDICWCPIVPRGNEYIANENKKHTTCRQTIEEVWLFVISFSTVTSNRMNPSEETRYLPEYDKMNIFREFLPKCNRVNRESKSDLRGRNYIQLVTYAQQRSK